MTTPTNKSIIKALDLIEVVCNMPDSPSLREAAIAAKLSVAATHRILKTLTGAGAVSLGSNGTYTLGPRLLALHERHTEARRLVQEAVDIQIRKLLTSRGICVRLCVLDATEIFTIAGADTCVDPKQHAKVGAHYESYCTAPGKVLLAGLSPHKLDEYVFNAGFIALTSRTIVTPSRLADEIKHVQFSGYAVDSGEFYDSVRAVAVPVRTTGGHIIAALSIAGVGMPLDDIPSLVTKLATNANELVQKICRVPHGLQVLRCYAGGLLGNL